MRRCRKGPKVMRGCGRGQSFAKEGAERAKVDVEVLAGQAELLDQLRHPLIELHQVVSEMFGLLVGDGSALDAADRLPFHELAEQFHDREHERRQAALGGLRIIARVQAVAAGRLGHLIPSSSGPARALTEASSARSEIFTRSTSAMDSVISPVIVTPPASTRSSRSTSAIRRDGSSASIGRAG